MYANVVAARRLGAGRALSAAAPPPRWAKSATIIPAGKTASRRCTSPSQSPLNILALETSSPWCSVALWLQGRIFATEELAGPRHSELLLPTVDALLKEAGVDLRSMQVAAFGAGPGSFTGLRIACGVAQGLAAGADLQTVGVGTLAAI